MSGKFVAGDVVMYDASYTTFMSMSGPVADPSHFDPAPTPSRFRTVAETRDWARRHGETLTELERDTLVAIVNHSTYAAAAKALGIEPTGVRQRLIRIRVKLDARSTTHAAALCFGLLGDRYHVRRVA